MIHLVYGNRTETLFERFARDLEAHRRKVGPLEPVTVVVPSRSVGGWLKRQLARRDGIAANLETLYLGQLAARLAAAPPARGLLGDAELAFDAVLSVLLDDATLAAPELQPARDYLHADESSDARELRRYQLARRLSHLFEEYAYSRPDMLACWARGEAAVGGDTEAWQRHLWRMALGPGGALDRRSRRTGESFVPLHGIDRVARSAAAARDGLFLFGVSFVGALVHRFLAALAQDRALHVYSLNPCYEFWEDVVTARERDRAPTLPHRGEQRPETAEPDAPLLVLWGRPGRENIRLLDALAGCDFDAAFDDPGGSTLLRKLQRDVLLRAPERPAPDPAFDFRDDASLRLLVCPNAQREAEAIASEIAALVVDTPGLRFGEICVLVAGPDPEPTFAQLRAAFGQRGREIPYVTDSGQPSPMAEAADLLLALPLERITRATVLRVLTHPAVLRRFPEVDPDAWARTVAAVGVYQDAANDGRFGWDQGLLRLALGDAMLGAASGQAEPVPIGGAAYFPEESGADGPSAALGLLARSLLSDVRFALAAQLPARRWAEFLSSYFSAYLVADGEDEERDRERCLQAVRAALDLDVAERRFGFRLAAELARAALSRLPARPQGRSGVTVSTLASMRALPFRAIFVAGLGEDRFPARPARDALDLRIAFPRPGDVQPREQDQYLFLEALLCARDRLCLSYVGRDEVTGDSLEPSSAVGDLLRLLRKCYLAWPAGAPAPFQRDVPLRRFDAASADAPAPPEVRIESRLAGLRRELDARRIGPGPERLRRALSEPSWRALEPLLGLLEPPPPADRSALPSARLSLQSLRRFLECPLQASARTLLRLEEDEEAPALLESEPFEASPLEATILRRELFERVVRGRGNAGELLARLSSPRIARGRLPADHFGSLEAPEHLQVVEAWRRAYEAHLAERGLGLAPPEILRFGAAAEDEEVDTVLPPIEIALGATTLSIDGRTSLLAGDRGHLVSVRARSKRTDEGLLLSQETLGGFLDHVALCAVLPPVERCVASFVRYAGGDAVPRLTWFAPIAGDEARRYLGDLAADLLGRVHDYLLPATAVFAFEEKRSSGASFADCVGAVLESGTCASLHGPIADPEAYPAPDDATAARRIERRFGLYFAARREAASQEGEAA